MTALEAAPAQDANAFVVKRETAERYGLRRLSDLTGVAPELTFGGPPECREAVVPRRLKDVYGLEFSEFVSLDAGGPLTREALDDDVVDVALLFTTDPALTNPDLVQLEDDRGLQPAENVTPLVRTAVADRWGPALVRATNAVSERLDDRSAPRSERTGRARRFRRRGRRVAVARSGEARVTTEVGATRRGSSRSRRSRRRSVAGHRRRRPSGAPPPLPRSIGITGKGWLDRASASSSRGSSS